MLKIVWVSRSDHNTLLVWKTAQQYAKQAAKKDAYIQAYTETDTHHSYTLRTLAIVLTCYCESRTPRKRKCNLHHSSFFLSFLHEILPCRMDSLKWDIALFKVIQLGKNTTLLVRLSKTFFSRHATTLKIFFICLSHWVY